MNGDVVKEVCARGSSSSRDGIPLSLSWRNSTAPQQQQQDKKEKRKTFNSLGAISIVLVFALAKSCLQCNEMVWSRMLCVLRSLARARIGAPILVSHALETQLNTSFADAPLLG